MSNIFCPFPSIISDKNKLAFGWKNRLNLRRKNNSQGAERTEVHVYLPYRGIISFYVYIVPLGLISIFLYVGRVQISCGLLPTRFCLNFPYKTIIVKKGEISDSFLAKTTCVIGKVIKNYIYHIIMVTLIFDVFVELWVFENVLSD